MGMNQYPNVKRKLAGRTVLMLAALGLLAVSFLTQGALLLTGRGAAAEPDPWMGMFLLAAGCGLVYAWLRSFGQRDVRRSQLARAAASYAGGDLEGALAALDGELGRPLYDSRQFTLTGSWLLGHVGSTRVPVAVPLGAVAGVYHHLMVRRIRTGRRNTHFFQVLLSDKFGRELVLQLKDKKQLDQVYGLLVKACPHAENGSFEDYVLGFGQLPEEERAARIRTVMEKNAADGMSHCEP